MDNRRYRIAKEGEKYCEICGQPFDLDLLDYSDPNNLACPGCLKAREEEGAQFRHTMKGVRPGKHMVLPQDAETSARFRQLSAEALQLIGHNAEMVRRLKEHLRKTRGIGFTTYSDLTIHAAIKAHSVRLEGQTNGIFSLEEFLDWAFAQPVLTEEDGDWFRPEKG